MGYRPNQTNPRARTQPPPPPPGRSGGPSDVFGLTRRPKALLDDLQDQQFDIINPRMSRQARWTLVGTGTGAVSGAGVGLALVGSEPLTTPGGVFATGVMALCAALGGIVAWGRSGEMEQAADADVEPGVEPEVEGEPVDQCEHVGVADFEAVPVEVDINGDGEKDVVAWLCSQCGAKVSGPEPDRLSTLQAALTRKTCEIASMADEIKAADCIISAQQYKDYLRAVDDVGEIERLMEAERRIRGE